MDFDSAVDYGPQLNVLNWLLVSISGLFLFTRLYLKNCQHRGLWWDDWILLAAWVALTAGSGIVAFLISLGYGKKFIPLANIRYFGLPVNILSTLMILTNLWGKTSFGVTLLRIPVRWMRICVWYILTTLTLTLTASVLLVWIECGPFKLRGTCVPIDVSIRYNVFSCVYSAVVDIALAFLPWKYLLCQQMNKKEKIGVMVAMSMGVFAGAAAAVKATTIPRVGGIDPRGSVPLIALGSVESGLCIIAASIPILRALARGGFRGPIILGYETGYSTSMVESELRSGAIVHSQTASLSLPIQAPRSLDQEAPGRRENTPDSPGKTLTAGSTGALGRKVDDDSSDEDSFEMTNYRTRPLSPVDFTRENAV